LQARGDSEAITRDFEALR